MYTYRVAFLVNGKRLNAMFVSPEEFSTDEAVRQRFRERAADAVKAYLAEARSVPRTGFAEAMAVWPEILPAKGETIQPLDAFEMTDLPN